MSNRQYLVVANWKMNGLLKDARSLVTTIRQNIGNADKTEVVICPPFLYIPELSSLLDGSEIKLGAQNVSHLESGALTSEISSAMLQDFGCHYVIVGHSECRTLYGENDIRVAEKFIAVQNAGMSPILCVGERLEERQSSMTNEVIARQLDTVIEMAGIKAFDTAVIAYEPVWAIGTGKTATPEQAQELHQFIRSRLAKHDQNTAEIVQILYGGSVKADNAKQLFEMADIDGGLIGGASLVAKDFLTICQAMR